MKTFATGAAALPCNGYDHWLTSSVAARIRPVPASRRALWMNRHSEDFVLTELNSSRLNEQDPCPVWMTQIPVGWDYKFILVSRIDWDSLESSGTLKFSVSGVSIHVDLGFHRAHWQKALAQSSKTCKARAAWKISLPPHGHLQSYLLLDCPLFLVSLSLW